MANLERPLQDLLDRVVEETKKKRANHQLCRDTEDDYLYLVEISYMGHVTDAE